MYDKVLLPLQRITINNSYSIEKLELENLSVKLEPEEHTVFYFYPMACFQCHPKRREKKGAKNPKVEGSILWFGPLRKEEITRCPTAFQALSAQG